MKKLKILKDEELERVLSEPVDRVTVALKDLVVAMHLAMNENKGIGLAAPQIGHYIRLLVFDCSNITGNLTDSGYMFNPEIVAAEGEEIGKEGCLSFPGITCEVKRYKTIRVRYLAIDNTINFKVLHGLAARVVQHEIAHLMGKTMLDEEIKNET